MPTTTTYQPHEGRVALVTGVARGIGQAIAVALAAVAAVSAAAAPRGPNGQLTFARSNPALDDTQAYVVNPDGTGERLIQGPTDTGEFPRWFRDGAHIATAGSIGGSPSLGGGSLIINPDDKTFRKVDGQYPGLFNPCGIPSPDGTLLLCETFSDGRHELRLARTWRIPRTRGRWSQWEAIWRKR